MGDGGHFWHSLPVEEVLRILGTDPERGLSQEEAQRRLEEYGPNRLREEPRPGFWARLWNQINDFLVMILIVSAIISAGIGWMEFQRNGEFTEFVDAIAIMAIVVLNAILGMVQEGKAEEALAALKKMAAPNAEVIRGGHVLTIPAADLVPGDIVILETGNYVPADLRLIESVNLRIEEASLTGESVPVAKDASMVLPEDTMLGDRRNCGYMGTVVTYGRGRGVVVATGMQTELGKIADLIQTTEEEPTPLQVKLEQLGKWLGTASLVICGIVGLLGILRDTDLGLITAQGVGAYLSQSSGTLIEMFMVAVSLAIAAVPEGLPAVVTICLALGMQEMVKRHALIRRLASVETLGSTTVICSDKTGTLTQNEMTVVQVFVDDTLIQVTGRGYDPEGGFYDDQERPATPEAYPDLELLCRASLLCNDARLEPFDENGEEGTWRMVGDPTEGALVVMAAKAGLWRKEQEQLYPRVGEVPFDSTRKRMSTIHRTPDGELVVFVKGAPDLVVELCDRIVVDGKVRPMTDTARERILEINRSLASNALRVLGVAYRPLDAMPDEVSADTVERELIFIGLTGMIDPARPEVREAIAVARRAGIHTVMVTGDYRDTAVAIAKELQLLRVDDPEERHVLTGAELDRLDDEEFAERVEEIRVYARVSPEHKVRIVDAWKRRGHVVAMTGDGVNDAPALKRASIGVAMGITGTDVTKETADMVLTDDNYASIVAAVEEGRIIYSNIRKFVYYLISCNMGEIVILFVSMLARLPLPLTPIQLLLLNLVTDGVPALALGVEKGEPGIMEQPPRPVNEPVINRPMIVGTIVQTIAIAVSVLAAFLIGLKMYGYTPEGIDHAETMAFVALSVSELFRAYTSRSERYPLASIGFFTNKWMQYAVLASLAIILVTVYVPFLNTEIFGNVPLSLQDWGILIPLFMVPAIAAEVQKAIRLRVERRRAVAVA